MPLFHHVPLRVMWSDTDPAGIVWFGVFFRYFENAEEELFRRLGRDRTPLLHGLGIFMPRTSLQSRFRSPARLGDEIAIGVGVGTITDRRVEYVFDIREQGSDRLICEASYRVACVDAKTFAPRTFPAEIRRLLSRALVQDHAAGATHTSGGTGHHGTGGGVSSSIATGRRAAPKPRAKRAPDAPRHSRR